MKLEVLHNALSYASFDNYNYVCMFLNFEVMHWGMFEMGYSL